MAMITPVDKIPVQNSQNDNIGDINDPLVKEVINDTPKIHAFFITDENNNSIL